MDERWLMVLRADVMGQLALIDEVYDKINERVAALQPGDDVQLESCAYQLHNYYGAVGDLFKLIAGYFENQVTDVVRWHIELLQRMRQEIPGVRPALISGETFQLLNGLRGFRHFFRHAYTAAIEFDQLRSNVVKAQQVHSLLQKDVALFLERLGA
jgi:hypothetical protein